MQRNVFLVQPGYLYGDIKKSAYLPYAAGALAAYAFSQAELKERFVFSGFICFFEPMDAAVAKLQTADVVGFSNYVWNVKYNCALAKRLKAQKPEIVIIFGGHQIAENDPRLREMTYVDYFIFGEGELAFASVLRTVSELSAVPEVPGIAYRDTDGTLVVSSGEPPVCAEYPSPYLTGFFDRLLETYPDISFIALFETNRGCPFHCAYCDWGTTKTQIRMFSMDRTAGEIAWFSSHKIINCFAADANFGLFERDEQIARMLIEAKRNTGFPERFDVTYAKSDNARVMRIASLLYKEKMSNGPSVSFQSLNPATLRAIGRENLTPERFSEVMRQYEAFGMRPYSEIILGLPEETFSSFVHGLGALLAMGQHSYIDVFRCEILVNSVLADPMIRERYGIETVRVPSSLHHVSKTDASGAFGESEIVVATSAMPKADMLRANLFSMTVQACHHMGLTKYIAIYLFRAYRIPYETFYLRLMEHLETGDDCFMFLRTVFESYLNGTREISVDDPKFGEITWFPEELFFLQKVFVAEAFYASLLPVLQTFLPDAHLAGQLLKYQSLFTVTPRCETKHAQFDYDFYHYFNGPDAELRSKPTEINMKLPYYDTWAECAVKTVWYGRRRAGTDAFASALEIAVE